MKREVLAFALLSALAPGCGGAHRSAARLDAVSIAVTGAVAPTVLVQGKEKGTSVGGLVGQLSRSVAAEETERSERMFDATSAGERLADAVVGGLSGRSLPFSLGEEEAGGRLEVELHELQLVVYTGALGGAEVTVAASVALRDEAGEALVRKRLRCGSGWTSLVGQRWPAGPFTSAERALEQVPDRLVGHALGTAVDRCGAELGARLGRRVGRPAGGADRP